MRYAKCLMIFVDFLGRFKYYYYFCAGMINDVSNYDKPFYTRATCTQEFVLR